MADTKRRVFISYSNKDSDSVKNILKAFDHQNIHYWSDQQIRAGQDWMNEVENALDQVSVFIILLSPDFISSDWAMYEIGYTISRSKETGVKIIPLRIREGIIPDILKQFQIIDARSTSPDEIAKIVKDIIKE